MRSSILVACLGSLAACTGNTSGNTSVACSPLTVTKAAPPPGWTGSVFTIVMENKSQGDILGNPSAPFINGLAKQGAVAHGYHDSFVHPSLSNYIWMVSGENFGILDDDDPASHHISSTSHIADQIERAGLTWKAYQEGMGAPCGLASHDRYAAKHDPFVYFDDITGWDGTSFHPSPRCTDHVVDYSQLATDIASGALANYVFITPNLDNDMHDGSVAAGDAWLARELPAIMATNAYKQGGTIFLLWDEGGGSPPADDPPFLVISPNGKSGFTSQADYDTSSYLETVQTILGVETLPCDAAVKSSISTNGRPLHDAARRRWILRRSVVRRSA